MRRILQPAPNLGSNCCRVRVPNGNDNIDHSGKMAFCYVFDLFVE